MNNQVTTMDDLATTARGLQQHGHSGDEYHVLACRCDLTNQCIDNESDTKMTRQTELFLCLQPEFNNMELVQIRNVTLKGNEYRVTPIDENGIPSNPHQTWITKNYGTGVWTIRTRLDTPFFTTLLPSTKEINVAAEGIAVLQKIISTTTAVQHEAHYYKNTTNSAVVVELDQTTTKQHHHDKKEKQAKKNKKNHKHPNHNNKHQHDATAPPQRDLLQRGSGNDAAAQNISVPFRVDILVQPDESLAVDYFVSYAPLVLFGITLALCLLSMVCRVSGERKRAKALNRSHAIRHSSRRLAANKRLANDDDDDEEVFEDEPSFVHANTPFEENIAQIARV